MTTLRIRLAALAVFTFTLCALMAQNRDDRARSSAPFFGSVRRRRAQSRHPACQRGYRRGGPG